MLCAVAACRAAYSTAGHAVHSALRSGHAVSSPGGGSCGPVLVRVADRWRGAMECASCFYAAWLFGRDPRLHGARSVIGSCAAYRLPRALLLSLRGFIVPAAGTVPRARAVYLPYWGRLNRGGGWDGGRPVCGRGRGRCPWVPWSAAHPTVSSLTADRLFHCRLCGRFLGVVPRRCCCFCATGGGADSWGCVRGCGARDDRVWGAGSSTEIVSLYVGFVYRAFSSRAWFVAVYCGCKGRVAPFLRLWRGRY